MDVRKTVTLLRTPKVLVVENDEDTLELLKFELSQKGVTGIQPAKNGKENFWFWFRRLFFIEALKVVIDFTTKFNSNSFKTI